MKKEDLAKIAVYIKDEVKRQVPYSSNRPSLKKQPFPRVFWLTLARASSSHKGVREKIRNWHMDISQDTTDFTIRYKQVTQPIPSSTLKNPTLWNWYQYLNKLPERSKLTKHKDGRSISVHNNIEKVAKNAVKFGIGNCGENADVAFTFLLEYPKNGIPEKNLPAIEEDILFERVSTTKGDHAFIVLNRKRGSDLNDMRTWGDGAFILDPWMNKVINVSEQLSNPSPTRCFTYIQYHENDLSSNRHEYGYISEGHTQSWLKQRKRKNEPVNLRQWPTFFNDTVKENVPWVKEEPDDCANNAKRRRVAE